jgi:hypothetical protein
VPLQVTIYDVSAQLLKIKHAEVGTLAAHSTNAFADVSAGLPLI